MALDLGKKISKIARKYYTYENIFCGKLKMRLSLINLLYFNFKMGNVRPPHAPYLYPPLSLDYNCIAKANHSSTVFTSYNDLVSLVAFAPPLPESATVP